MTAVKSFATLTSLGLLAVFPFPDSHLLAQIFPASSSPVTGSPAPKRPQVMAPEGTISAELLRYPITEKARSMLQKALELMKSEKHEAAITKLLETLSKYPGSAAYVHSLIGIEYLRTAQYRDAANSFEQAVLLLPHDPVNRYNFGLSLVCVGDYKRGEQEVRRAAELDPRNPTIRAFLDALLQHLPSGN
jgi:Flp pilus assembly protein TadD